MTCIAAITNPGTGQVWMGGDSLKTFGDTVMESPDSKICAVKRSTGTWLFGGAGPAYFNQALRDHLLSFEAPDEATPDYVSWLRTKWIPSLRETAVEQNWSKLKENVVSTDALVLVAGEGRLYIIDSNLGLSGIKKPFMAIGSGGSFAHGALWGFERDQNDLSPEERIREAIRGASQSCPGVGGDVDVLSG